MRLDLGAYQIDEVDAIESPGLIIFVDLVRANIERMISIAGSAERLRPHCKTHKTREIVQIEMSRGISRHKCATIAEAEMLLGIGVTDVFLAYQPVGPNLRRVVSLAERFRSARISVAIDHPAPLTDLSEMSQLRGVELGVWLDVDSGMNRTGIEIGDDAIELYESICVAPGIRAMGLHWYDGHIRNLDFIERKSNCLRGWERLLEFRNRLMVNGLLVPGIVAGGTGSFPFLAEFDEPGLELSPGTTAYFDAGYRRLFPDLKFVPALGILTRVVSCNRDGYLTLDLGHKACAADPPAGSRLEFPEWTDAEEVMHTEEHLVIKTHHSSEQRIGGCTLAIPVHVCPTSAAYDFATVIEGGHNVGTWDIFARRRKITI